MDRNSIDWQGPMPAVITPFDDDGAIDETAMKENIDRMFEHGATGVLIGGCTGEFWALSFDERCRLLEIGVEHVAGRGTVLGGTGAVTAEETIRLSKAAEAAGCDGALVLPPYFIRLSDDEVFEHFRTVDAEVSIPIVLYNIPGNAINAIGPELALKLAKLEQVVAIKESSGDWNNFYSTLLAVHRHIRVFCGPSSIFGVPAHAAGADGFIDCFPNLWLPGGLDLWHVAAAGHSAEAQALQIVGRRLTDLFTSGGRSLYPATKAAMTALGFKAGDPRPPLQPLSGDALHGLTQGLAELNIL